MRTRYSFFCDFDGTVSVRDVTDVLLETYALPEWRDIEALWQAGDIGSMECMQRQVSLLRCTRRQLDAVADAVAIDPGFPDFVAACREAAMPVAIVSDGIDYCIRRVLRQYGLDWLPVHANRLTMSGDGRYALTFPSAHADCLSASGTCKCARMRTLRQPGTTAVLIGDGASDFCAAREEADFVFAKGALLDFCREQALPHMAYTDFYDVKRVLSNPQQGPHDAERRAADPTFAGYFLHG